MAARVKLDHGPGTAPWMSDGIRLRDQRETNPAACSNHVDPSKGAQQYLYAYVHLTNNGVDPIGVCRCQTTGSWNPPRYFNDNPVIPPAIPPDPPTIMSPSGTSRVVAFSATQLRLERLDAQTGNWVQLGPNWPIKGKDGAGVANQGLPSFWDWSPDPASQFFALVVRDQGNPQRWILTVFAVQGYDRNGTWVPAGAIIPQPQQPPTSIVPNVIEGSYIGWGSGGRCLVFAVPPSQTNSGQLMIIAPYSGTAQPASDTQAVGTAGGLPAIPFTILHSPCGDLCATVPKATGQQLKLLRFGLQIAKPSPRQNNQDVTIQVTAQQVSISTTRVGQLGVTLAGMSTNQMDNLDCIAEPAGTVDLRRARCTTTPQGYTVDFTAGGTSSMAVPPNGGSIWVEFPQTAWIDPGTGAHYCLQAIGQASDDPGPGWNAFNGATDDHCAQRNIEFI